MAELELRVNANYDSAIKCREELKKVDAELKNISADASPEKIHELIKKRAELATQWENHMSLIGKTSAYAKEAYEKIFQAVKASVDETEKQSKAENTTIAALEKRLAIEEQIQKTIENQREQTLKTRKKNEDKLKENQARFEGVKASLNEKYDGQPTAAYSKEDQAKLEAGNAMVEKFRSYIEDLDTKLSVYDSLLVQSTERTETFKTSLQGLREIEIENTTLNAINDKIEQGKENISALKGEVDNLNGTKATLELEVKKNNEDIAKLTDVDSAKVMLADNENTLNAQTQETQNLSNAIDDLLKKESDLQMQDGLMEQQKETLIAKTEESENRFNSLMETLSGMTEGTQEYIETSKQAEGALAETIGYENELHGIQAGLEGIREEYQKVVEERLGLQKDLSHSKQTEKNLLAEHERLEKWIDSGVEDNAKLEEAKNNIDEANKKLAETNEALGQKNEILKEAEEKLKESEEIRQKIEEIYVGMNDMQFSQSSVPQVFASEDMYSRYKELNTQISTLQEQIKDKTSSGNYSINEITELQERLSEARKEFYNLSDASQQTAVMLGEKFADRASSALNRLYALNENVRKTSDEFTKMENQVNASKDAMIKAESEGDGKAYAIARSNVETYEAALERLRAQLNMYTAQQKDALADVERLRSEMERPSNNELAKGMSQALDAVDQKAKDLMKTIAGIAGISVGLSQVKGFFSQAENWRQTFEDAETSMKIFLGTEEKAHEFNEKLKNYSFNSLYHYNELMTVSRQMLALGMDTEEAMTKIDKLANLAAATHSSLSNVVSMYTRAKTMGSVMTRQLVTWQNLGLDVKGTLAEMGESVNKSTISFSQLNKVIDKVTDSGGKFDGAQKEMLGNLSAEIDTYKNKMEIMFDAIGKQYEDVFVKFIRLQTDVVDNYKDMDGGFLDFGAETAGKAIEYLSENWRSLIDTIKAAIAAFGVYKATMITGIAIEKSYAFYKKLSAAASTYNTDVLTKENVAEAANTTQTEINSNAKRRNRGAQHKKTLADVKNTAAQKTNTASTGQNTIVQNANTASKEAQTVATKKATIATVALDKAQKALAANPLTAIAVALAAVAFATVKAAEGVYTQEKAQRMLNEVNEEYLEQQKEKLQQSNSYISTIKSETASLMEQTEAYRKLIKERKILAGYSQEEIKNMSSEQLDRLLKDDDAKKIEQNYREQAEAAQELLRQTYIHPFTNFDTLVDKVLKKYEGRLDDFGKAMKEENGFWTQDRNYMEKIVQQTSKNLQDHYANSASNGIQAGLLTGVSDPKLQNKMSGYLNKYKEIYKSVFSGNEEDYDRFNELRKKLKEEGVLSGKRGKEGTEWDDYYKAQEVVKDMRKSYNDLTSDLKTKVKRSLSEAEKDVKRLNDELARTPEDKKAEVQVKLTDASNQRDALWSFMNMLNAGFDKQEVLVEVREQYENEILDDETIIEIGNRYRDIDDIAQGVANRVEDAKNEYDSLAKKSDEALKKILSDANLTADGIDNDFSKMRNDVVSDINTLRNKMADLKKENKDTGKLEIEIQRKEQQLNYIDDLKSNLKKLVKDPYKIEIDIKALVPKSWQPLFTKMFGINFDEEVNNVSTRAQDVANQKENEQKQKDAEDASRKSVKQFRADEKAGDKKKINQWQKFNSGKGELTMEVDGVEKTFNLEKLTPKEYADLKKATEDGKKLAQQARKNDTRAKRISDDLKFEDEMEKMRLEAERAREDARIAAIENNGERERETRKEQHKRTLADLERQNDEIFKKIYEQRKAEYKLKHKDSDYETTSEGQRGWRGVKADYTENKGTFTVKELQQITVQRQTTDSKKGKENSENLRKEKEIVDAQKKALRDYIKENGTDIEKLKAIEEDFAFRIGDAKTFGEQLSLAKKQVDEEEKVRQQASKEKMDKIKVSIDWEGLFNDLDKYSVEYLEKVRGDLQDMMKDPNLTPTDRKVISEKINDTTSMINSKKENTFNWVNDYLVERKRLEEEAARAATEYNEALKKQQEATDKVSDKQGNIADIIENTFGEEQFEEMYGSTADIKASDGEDIIKQLGIDENSEAAKKIRDAFIELSQAEKEATNATDKLTEAEGKKSNAEEKTKVKLKDQVAGFMDSLNKDVQKYLGDLPKLLDQLGFGTASEKVSEGLTGLNDATNAVADFASGNYIGAVVNGISAVQNFGSALGIGGGNADETNKQMAKLSARNELLTKAIDRLTEAMNKTSGAGSIRQFKKLSENQKELVENLQKNLRLQMGYNSAHHSFNYYWKGFSQSEIDQFNQRNGTNWNGDLGNITPDIAAMLEADADMIEKIQNTGYGNYGGRVVQWISQLAEQAGVAREQVESLYAALTADTTKDTFVSDFLKDLYDVADGVNNITANIEKRWQQMVNQMVINDAIGEEINDWIRGTEENGKHIDGWADRLGKVNQDYTMSKKYRSMTDSEFNAYIKNMSREEQNEARRQRAMTDEEYRRKILALEEERERKFEELSGDVKEMRDVGVIKDLDSIKDQQSSTFNSAQNITYEQGDTIAGSLINQSMLMEQSNQHLSLLTATAETISKAAVETNDSALDAKDILAGMAIHVEEIRDGVVDTIVPRIKTMDENISKLKQLVEAQ